MYVFKYINCPELVLLEDQNWCQPPDKFTKKLIEDYKDWVSNDWKEGNIKVLDYACGEGLASRVSALRQESHFQSNWWVG